MVGVSIQMLSSNKVLPAASGRYFLTTIRAILRREVQTSYTKQASRLLEITMVEFNVLLH